MQSESQSTACNTAILTMLNEVAHCLWLLFSFLISDSADYFQILCLSLWSEKYIY